MCRFFKLTSPQCTEKMGMEFTAGGGEVHQAGCSLLSTSSCGLRLLLSEYFSVSSPALRFMLKQDDGTLHL